MLCILLTWLTTHHDHPISRNCVESIAGGRSGACVPPASRQAPASRGIKARLFEWLLHTDAEIEGKNSGLAQRPFAIPSQETIDYVAIGLGAYTSIAEIVIQLLPMDGSGGKKNMRFTKHDKAMRLLPLNIAPPTFLDPNFLRLTTVLPFVLFVSFPFLACFLVQIMPVCPQCDNRSFSNKEALLQHMKSSSAWHPFCSICDRRFVSQPAFDAVSFSPDTIVLLDLQLLIAHGGQTPADIRLHNL